MPGSLRYARQFADARRLTTNGGKMSRFYAIESTPSLSGAVADHRWPVKSRDIERVKGAEGADLQGLYAMHAVVDRTRGAGEVENIVYFSDVEGFADVLLRECEARLIGEMG